MRQPRHIAGRYIDKLRSLLSGQWPAFVVASMGRAGSMVVYKALVTGLSSRRFGLLGPNLVHFVKGHAWDLSATDLIGGVVYKTHGFPDGLKPKWPIKIIFTFGSASDSAVSLYLCLERYGRKWIEDHLKHLRADGPFEDIFQRDVLRFEEQIKSWSSVTDLDVLAVRYETLWDHVDTLSDFVGFPVSLPPRRARLATTADPEIVRRAQALYGELDTQIAALPDVFRPPLLGTSCLVR